MKIYCPTIYTHTDIYIYINLIYMFFYIGLILMHKNLCTHAYICVCICIYGCVRICVCIPDNNDTNIKDLG